MLPVFRAKPAIKRAACLTRRLPVAIGWSIGKLPADEVFVRVFFQEIALQPVSRAGSDQEHTAVVGGHLGG